MCLRFLLLSVQWSEELPGIKQYLRTPETYGYYTLTYSPQGGFYAALSGVYTGKMLIPHYGFAGNPGTPEQDILFESPEWKVQVGDYKTRLEADRILNEISMVYSIL